MRRGDGANTCATVLQVCDALQVNVRAAGGCGGLRGVAGAEWREASSAYATAGPFLGTDGGNFQYFAWRLFIILDFLHSAWTGPTSVIKRV